MLVTNKIAVFFKGAMNANNGKTVSQHGFQTSSNSDVTDVQNVPKVNF